MQKIPLSPKRAQTMEYEEDMRYEADLTMICTVISPRQRGRWVAYPKVTTATINSSSIFKVYHVQVTVRGAIEGQAMEQ